MKFLLSLYFSIEPFYVLFTGYFFIMILGGLFKDYFIIYVVEILWINHIHDRAWRLFRPGAKTTKNSSQETMSANQVCSGRIQLWKRDKER